MEQLEKLDPQANQRSRDQFLSNFKWTDSTIDQQTKLSVEDLLVQFNHIFARQRFAIGINKDFKKNPLLLKGDILVEIALVHKNAIITTLPSLRHYHVKMPAPSLHNENITLKFDF